MNAGADSDTPITWYIFYQHGIMFQSTASTQYLISFYWVITTITTGYGDITALTQAEVALTLAVLFISALILGYLIGAVTNFTAHRTQQAREYHATATAVRTYMRTRRLSAALQVRVLRYVRYVYGGAAAGDARGDDEAMTMTVEREMDQDEKQQQQQQQRHVKTQAGDKRSRNGGQHSLSRHASASSDHNVIASLFPTQFQSHVYLTLYRPALATARTCFMSGVRARAGDASSAPLRVHEW